MILLTILEYDMFMILCLQVEEPIRRYELQFVYAYFDDRSHRLWGILQG